MTQIVGQAPKREDGSWTKDKQEYYQLNRERLKMFGCEFEGDDVQNYRIFVDS